MEAIILAGGLGTRLRNVISDLPKPMAPICGRPFLAILLDKLVGTGFTAVTLAVGYRHEVIQEYFGRIYKSLRLNYSVEREPLGTGGAIRLALKQTTKPHIFVINGDTHLELDYATMLAAHLDAEATLSIAVRAALDASRYGALDIEQGRIRGFFEKGRSGSGVINGGIYLLSRKLLDSYPLPHIFSFESDFVAPNVETIRPLAFQTDGAFIDIGIPEDYARAQELLAPLSG